MHRPTVLRPDAEGASGRVKREHFDDQESAQAAMLKIRDEQIERGYQVVFMQAQPLT